MAETGQMLDPFVDHSVRKGVISFGLGPYGYDIRLDRTYKTIQGEVDLIDPHTILPEDFEAHEDERIIIPPGKFILGKSLEYFRIPKKILGIVFGKSTYARAGILVNVTPLEPEWSGFLTISIANTGSMPVCIYPMQGIAQVIFLESDDLPLFSYQDLGGKYNQQQEITVPKIDP